MDKSIPGAGAKDPRLRSSAQEHARSRVRPDRALLPKSSIARQEFAAPALSCLHRLMHQTLPAAVSLALSFTLSACDLPTEPNASSTGQSTVTIYTDPTSTFDTTDSSSSSSSASSSSSTSTSATNSTSSSSTASSPFTKIHEIQGTGEAPTMQRATVQAIVTGTYQGQDELKGFFIQEEDADADQNPKSSEALFVYCGSCSQKVKVGDLVEIQGPVADYYGMTQLNISRQGTLSIIASNRPLPTPVALAFPLPVTAKDLAGAQAQASAYLESFEGMRVRIEQPMSIGNIYHLPRYGEIELVAKGRIRQFTDTQTPSVQGFIAHQIDALSRRILWDDASNTQNVSTLGKGGDQPVFHPQPDGFSVDNSVRAGNVVRDLVGVLHWSYSGQKGTDAWRIRSAQEKAPKIEKRNPRPELPASKGELKVAAFNVLNFFSTLDGQGAKCGPNKNLGCRGAHSKAELKRQGDKISAAICAMDADIVGLMEIENNDRASLDALVAALDRRCPGYKALASGSLGTDAIKVGFIYKSQSVAPQGKATVLTDPAFTDPNKLGSAKNRPALLATFLEASSGQDLSIVVNHLKSKGSPCGAGDDDQAKGQGNCNQTRTLAAQYLAKWLKNNASSSKILILGDLNAYRFEDPIQALVKAGYVDLVQQKSPGAHSYVFAGQLGNLDYALANAELAAKVKSATVWNINADESQLLDYNDSVLDPGEKNWARKSSARPLYRDDAFRSSDHDPVIVGISLQP